MSSKIGKGGNGFVFTMYHDRKQYAVKKVNVFTITIIMANSHYDFYILSIKGDGFLISQIAVTDYATVHI